MQGKKNIENQDDQEVYNSAPPEIEEFRLGLDKFNSSPINGREAELCWSLKDIISLSPD